MLIGIWGMVGCPTERSSPSRVSNTSPPVSAPSVAGGASARSPAKAASGAVSAASSNSRLRRGKGPLHLLWRKTDGDYGVVIDHEAARKLTDPERAAVGYLAAQINADCSWHLQPEFAPDGAVSQGELECELTRALGLGYQCGDAHRDFLRKWLGDDIPSRCRKVPRTAFVQSTLDDVRVDVQKDRVIVTYSALKTEGPGGKTWSWSEVLEFSLVGPTRLKVEKETITKGKAPWQSGVPK